MIWTLYFCLSTKSWHSRMILTYFIVFLIGLLSKQFMNEKDLISKYLNWKLWKLTNWKKIRAKGTRMFFFACSLRSVYMSAKRACICSYHPLPPFLPTLCFNFFVLHDVRVTKKTGQNKIDVCTHIIKLISETGSFFPCLVKWVKSK